MLCDTVKYILENHEKFNWSLQGFGMLRLYLSNEVRLHVWDDRYRALDVSDIHTHPWDFESEIVVGIMNEFVYMPQEFGVPYKCVKIQCGENACVKEELPSINLVRRMQQYRRGDTYKRSCSEIHKSEPLRGTVSIIRRRFHKDTEHALVFFDINKPEFIDAKPQKATPEIVKQICENSLNTWFTKKGIFD